jgi:hypothetical protein
MLAVQSRSQSNPKRLQLGFNVIQCAKSRSDERAPITDGRHADLDLTASIELVCRRLYVSDVQRLPLRRPPRGNPNNFSIDPQHSIGSSRHGPDFVPDQVT